MTFNVALSGIQAASSELGVVGNNVANASTNGFKASRADFSDVYAASALGTSSTSIGNGVRLTSVSQAFTQGTISVTSRSLDMAINGQGFFKLNDNGTVIYTRAGSFGVDREGFIVNKLDQRLTGFLSDSNGKISGAEGDLKVDTSNLSPSATDQATIGVNVSANSVPPAGAWVGSPNFGDAPPAPSTFNNSTSTTIYDSLGNPHILSAFFIKSNTANEWDVRVQVDGVDVDSAGGTAPFRQVYSNDGAFNLGASEAINISWAPLDANGNPNGANTPETFSIDLESTTQYGSPFSVQSILQDGFATGRLDSVDIDVSGIMFGRYTNGQSRPMGQIALANFSNPNGLQPIGDSGWGESFSSGSALIGSPGTATLGVIQSGSLEDSNVDLTEELVKMIVAQRNFQASAQTIRTADAVTQTIINLR